MTVFHVHTHLHIYIYTYVRIFVCDIYTWVYTDGTISLGQIRFIKMTVFHVHTHLHIYIYTYVRMYVFLYVIYIRVCIQIGLHHWVRSDLFR